MRSMNTWYCSPAPIRNRLGRNEMQSQNLKRRSGSEKPAWLHPRGRERLPRLSRSASLNFAHYCACLCVCVFRIPICTYNPLFCSLMLIALPKFCKCEMLRHARRVEHLLSRLASHPPVCLPVCTPPRETGIRGLGGLTVWMAYE